MSTRDQIKTGTTSLQEPVTPVTSLGAHTRAPNVLPAPSRTGGLGNRGGGARPIGGAR